MAVPSTALEHFCNSLDDLLCIFTFGSVSLLNDVFKLLLVDNDNNTTEDKDSGEYNVYNSKDKVCAALSANGCNDAENEKQKSNTETGDDDDNNAVINGFEVFLLDSDDSEEQDGGCNPHGYDGDD